MNFFDKKYSPFIVIFITVFISRIPFLFDGYGIEEDSWGIALAAFHTKISGVYEPSRLPGHPFQELIYSVLWGTGPLLYNGLCAFFSAIASTYFALVLKLLQFKHYLIAAFAFAFIPVFFISSTYTIDFVWTEAFVLISLYYLLKNKLITCGLFLGLAVGCRITSGVMLLPFLLIIWQNNQWKTNGVALLKIALPMAFVSIALFTPIIQQYGINFFMYYDQFPYPPLAKVMYKMIIGVFGLVGTIAVFTGVLSITMFNKKQNSNPCFTNGLDRKIILASFLIIVLYIISYLRLPQKSGYMIPILPFLLLLFGYYLNSKNFRLLCVALIVSSFILSINLTDKIRGAEFSKHSFVFKLSGQEIFLDPFSGPIFSDLSKRKQKIKYTESVIEKTNTLQQKTVVIAGWWYNEVMVELIEKNKNNFVIFESYINELKINNYLKNGYQIVYLPEQNKYNDLMYKMDITNTIATELN